MSDQLIKSFFIVKSLGVYLGVMELCLLSTMCSNGTGMSSLLCHKLLVCKQRRQQLTNILSLVCGTQRALWQDKSRSAWLIWPYALNRRTHTFFPSWLLKPMHCSTSTHTLYVNQALTDTLTHSQCLISFLELCFIYFFNSFVLPPKHTKTQCCFSQAFPKRHQALSIKTENMHSYYYS